RIRPDARQFRLRPRRAARASPGPRLVRQLPLLAPEPEHWPPYDGDVRGDCFPSSGEPTQALARNRVALPRPDKSGMLDLAAGHEGCHMPGLEISPAKVGFVIIKAREIAAKVEPLDGTATSHDH